MLHVFKWVSCLSRKLSLKKSNQYFPQNHPLVKQFCKRLIEELNWTLSSVSIFSTPFRLSPVLEYYEDESSFQFFHLFLLGYRSTAAQRSRLALYQASCLFCQRGWEKSPSPLGVHSNSTLRSMLLPEQDTGPFTPKGATYTAWTVSQLRLVRNSGTKEMKATHAKLVWSTERQQLM